MRESLLAAAEKRLESRIAQLKQLEAQLNEAARSKDEGEATRLKNLVTMYENMKPKDAARIFDRLDMRILLEVATQINPRRMSDILAQMTPESAERLTVELASRGRTSRRPNCPRSTAARHRISPLPLVIGSTGSAAKRSSLPASGGKREGTPAVRAFAAKMSRAGPLAPTVKPS